MSITESMSSLCQRGGRRGDGNASAFLRAEALPGCRALPGCPPMRRFDEGSLR